MTWLATKIFLKKTWAAICKYWQYFALAVYTIVIYILFKKNKNTEAIKSAFTASKKTHKAELEAINNAHKEELAARDVFIEDYNKTVMKLDEEYRKQKLTLHEWEKKVIKKIVKETHNDPEGRVKKIAEEFGFELVLIDGAPD
jgi:hypothetical protein